MHVQRFDDAAEFVAATEAPLREREAYFNLPLSVARHCLSDPTRYTDRNYFCAIYDPGRTCGVAVMTPPHRLLLCAPPESAAAVAEELHRGGWSVSGVHAPHAAAVAFAEAWCAPRGLVATQRMALRAFELREVTPAPPVSGHMRRAGEADNEIAGAWYRGFTDEATPGLVGTSPEEQALRAIRQKRLFLWDDGGPVAQAVRSGTTPRGARIGAVYTPPDRRRHGYATALVAALSAHLLATGREFTFLFTDLANPVSNSIYPKVGYCPNGDFHELVFTAAARPRHRHTSP